jgi:cell division protein FtsI (penicillin-binding protein 3)
MKFRHGSHSIGKHSANPLLTVRTPVWRSKFVVAALALGFVVLAARAAYIQVFSNNFFQKQGAVRYLRTLELPATRGRILDRNGQLLATSVLAPSIWAIPEDVADEPQKWQKLARLLDMPLSDLKRKLQEDRSFVWLKRQVDEPVARQIAALGIDGIYQTKEYKRQYPEGEAAAHLVGFTNVEDQGLEGVELAFNEQLAGKNGSRRVIKDRLGRVIESVGTDAPPVEGHDVQLSIDSKIQFFAYEQLKQAVQAQRAQSGSVVVLDAQSGELLAMTNYPSYVPDARNTSRRNQFLRNSALTDTFEPGSTVKPFVAALALERGIATPNTRMAISPNAQYRFAGATITDTHPYPVLTLAEVVQKSSNIGISKFALQMPASDLWEMYSQIGFGQRPQLSFPGVVSGRLRPWQTWKPIEHATMSYGYGIAVSLMQLAQAYTVFAHDGALIPVTLQKTDAQAAPGARILSAEHAVQVRQMLHMVTGPGGTAPKAQTQGYSVGGKTGTARKLDANGTYSMRDYRSVFVGLAPVARPRIIVAVMIDQPVGQIYGGDVAAPVFSATVQETLHLLGVPPDLDVKPQIVAGADVKGGRL